jgi:hypothetical protein
MNKIYFRSTPATKAKNAINLIVFSSLLIIGCGGIGGDDARGGGSTSLPVV